MKAHWPVALVAVGIAGTLTLFAMTRQWPSHPLWFWFAVTFVAGLILDRWSALWLALVPSVTIVSAIGWSVLREPPSAGGDFVSDPMIVAVLISIWLAFIGFWGILIGFAGRAVLRSVVSTIEF